MTANTQIISATDHQLNQVLVELEQSLSTPLEEARSMPPAAYRSEALLELELEKIFRRDWQCTGRVEMAPNPGDYYTYEVAGEPLIIHRDSTGTLKAFSNVCLHRLAPLAEGTGNTERFMCPYHRWTYDENGQLLFTPHAKDIDCSTYKLKQVKLEIWQGWVFVNLDDDAGPLAPKLTGLEALVSKYDMSNMETVVWNDTVWDTNWKILAENFMESYHLFCVHPRTVQQTGTTKSTRAEPGTDAYTFHWYTAPDDRPTWDTPLTHLTEAEIRDGFDFDIFPANLIAYGAAGGFWIMLQPQGVGQVRIRWGYSAPTGRIPDGAEGDAERKAIIRYMDKVNSEDKEIVEAIYRSTKSRYASRSKLVMPDMEQCIAEFQRYLANRLI